MHVDPIEYYDEASGGTIPVFKPTLNQFKDFKKFVNSINKYGSICGIVKVIPPTEWQEKLPDIIPKLEKIRVHNPIEQHIIGNGGLYRQTNIEKQRPFTINQWHKLCDQKEHRLPNIHVDRSLTVPIKKKKVGQENIVNYRPFSKVEQKNKEISIAKSDQPEHLNLDLKTLISADQFNEESCHEFERKYWRNLTFTQPLYGADMEGSLFDETVKSWNIANLDNLLSSVNIRMPGVNTPYLYFGMWKATFAWHVEDMDLYSINYLHFGSPKQWYSIKPEHKKKFEQVMQNLFFQDYKKCKEFLRHKTSIVSPSLLARYGIPVQRCVQHQGEFIITFPYAYHSGYNLGFNCAESVNFALDSWISIGKQAKSCHCIHDSVTIDVTDIEKAYKKKRKRRKN